MRDVCVCVCVCVRACVCACVHACTHPCVSVALHRIRMSSVCVLWVLLCIYRRIGVIGVILLMSL